MNISDFTVYIYTHFTAGNQNGSGNGSVGGVAGQGRGRGRGTTVATGRGTTMAQMNGLPSQPLGMGVAYQNGHVPDAASMVHSGPQSTVRSENQSSSPVFSVGIGRGSRATNGKLPKCNWGNAFNLRNKLFGGKG